MNISLFACLLDHTKTLLLATGFVQQLLSDEHERQGGKLGLSLRSLHLKHPFGTEMRSAYLISERVEILNLMIYPRNALAVPIFAVEYIAFNARPFVAVADLQPALGVGSGMTNEIVSLLKNASEDFSSRLSDGGELPDWAADYFTPICIYARPKTESETEVLCQAYKHYLEVWCEKFFVHENGELAGKQALSTYQHHHVINTPGRTFLTKAFGQDWTELYLANFMYCSS